MRRRTIAALFCLAVLACGSRGAAAQARHDHGSMSGVPTAKPCPDAALTCAVSATPFFAADGTLYLAWSAGGRIAVAHSSDKGAHFSPPAFANPTEEVVDAGPDSRPSIVVDGNGRITVAYAIFRDKAFNGEVRVTHADRGGAFARPVPIADNPASQRFQSLLLDRDGSVFAAWLDKRKRLDLPNPKDYAGAALAWTRIPPGGEPSGAARLGSDNTCECCRLGIASAGPGRPVVLFRDIFHGSVRDHAVIAFDADDNPGPTQRVSDDDWVITACPHHGPSLAIDGSGGWHAAWFTQGKQRSGLFYAHSDDQGASFSAPLPVGSPGAQAGRPNLLAMGDTVYLAWKQFDGALSAVNLMVSRDRGAHFGAPKVVATTRDASDHPLLIAHAATPYLSWLSANEGYRLIPLGAGE
ncbi:MAG: hypothetical protein U1E70_20785 [Acetobacteraceae bacterium]